MALSNNYDFQLNTNQIIDEAYRLSALLDETQSPTSDQYTNARQSLNIIMKHLMSKGVKIWRYEDLILLPTLNENKFLLKGAGGARFFLAKQFVQTALNGNAVIGDTTVTVDSVSGISSGSEFGFYNTATKKFGWRVVDSISGNNVNLTTAITENFADNTIIYSYPSTTSKPLKISDATVQLSTNNETIMQQISQREWRELSIKVSNGIPTQFYYKPAIGEGELYIWPQVDDELKYINLTTERQFDDLDSSTDNPSVPTEYYQILIYSLASRLAFQYGFSLKSQELERKLDKDWQDMKLWDHQEADMRFEFDTPILGDY